MKFKRFWVTFSIFIICLNIATSADFDDNSKKSKDKNILLQSADKSSLLANPNIIEKEISNLSKSYEKVKWIFSVNDKTDINTYAFGKPVKIEGYTNFDNSNIEKAAKDFLRQNFSSFNIDPDALKLSSVKFINNRWYVSFSQYYNGIKVLLSDVQLRIFKNGNVFAVKYNYFNNIQTNLIPTISIEKTKNYAIKDLDFIEREDTFLNSKELYVLPIKTDNYITYKLVYNCDINLNSQNKSYFSYIDANTGDILWRQNKIFDALTNIKVEGNIKTQSSLSDEERVSISNQYFNISDSLYKSNNDGNIEINIDKPTKFTASFSGPFAEVVNADKINPKIQDSIYPNNNINFLWSNSNSMKQQRYLFYHTNFIHEYLKNIDPELTVMDFPIKVLILYEFPLVNASSEGKLIQFFGAGLDGYYFAETPEILYHEYGHSLNTLLYQSLGKDKGMINMACHEGLADITALLVKDLPIIGKGAYEDSTQIIRNIENTMKYPQDISGECHNDGLILSGAFWDLRKAVSLDFVRHISHFARYGTPDDPDTGLAFINWLFETIVADDDDGDLTNGTPHLKEISESFEKHGIHGVLGSYYAFRHIPPERTKDTVNPYILDFTIQAIPFLYSLDSVSLIYSTDKMVTLHKVLAFKEGNNNFKATIPAQPRGTAIKYYFSAWNKTNQQYMYYSISSSEIKPYTLLVGYECALFADFESDTGWKTTEESINGKKGSWERNIPAEAIQLIWVSDTETIEKLVQIGKNHTKNGKYCLITDATGGRSTTMMQYMPQGTTSIQSPVYDMSKLKNPIINYYRWFYNMPFGFYPGANFSTEISFDNGEHWKTVERYDEKTYYGVEWQKCSIEVKDFGTLTDKVILKFKVNNPLDENNNPTANAEALVDDLEIITQNDEIISSIEDHNVSIEKNDINIYPNPVKDFANISYKVKYESHVIIKLINSIGETVSILLDENKPSGTYNLEWNLLNNSKMKILPGLYFLQFNSQSEINVTKIIIY